LVTATSGGVKVNAHNSLSQSWDKEKAIVACSRPGCRACACCLQTVRLASGLSSAQHTIEIYKDTEAKNPRQPGYATLKKIVLSTGGRWPSVRRSGSYLGVVVIWFVARSPPPMPFCCRLGLHPEEASIPSGVDWGLRADGVGLPEGHAQHTTWRRQRLPCASLAFPH
jgi:hypothetical protein